VTFPSQHEINPDGANGTPPCSPCCRANGLHCRYEKLRTIRLVKGEIINSPKFFARRFVRPTPAREGELIFRRYISRVGTVPEGDGQPPWISFAYATPSQRVAELRPGFRPTTPRGPPWPQPGRLAGWYNSFACLTLLVRREVLARAPSRPPAGDGVLARTGHTARGRRVPRNRAVSARTGIPRAARSRISIGFNVVPWPGGR